jgi:hypothetical protein
LPVAYGAGLSVLLLSPAFFLLVRARLRDCETRDAAIAGGLLLAVMLMYYAEGEVQFGPRYLTDAMPLAYLVLVGVCARIGVRGRYKAVIAASALVNLALFWLFILYRMMPTALQ